MVDPVTLQMVRDVVAIFGVIAGFSYYVMTVRNAQKARQTQTLMQLYQTRYSSEGVKRLWRIMRMEWRDFDDYMEKYSPDIHPESEDSAQTTGSWNFYDGLGVLVKKGIVDIETVHSMLGIRILMVWYKCETIIKGLRRMEPEGPGMDYVENFEYLAHEMIRIRKQRGLKLPLSRLHPTSTLLRESL